jgi:glycosyltransferase involved in cell wall biosynthesis
MPHVFRKPILLVVRGLDAVGSGRQAALVAAGLMEAGADVHVAVTTAGGCLPGELAAAGCTVHRVGRRPVVDAAAAAGIVTLVARLQPGVVTAWGRSQVPLVVGARCAAVAVKLAGWLARPVRGPWATAMLRRLDCVVAASPATAESCRRLGVAERRIEPIPPGIGPAAAARRLPRADVARRLGLDPARQWTLCVAPLEADSRLDRLIWAIDQLGVVRRDLQHVLVGAGPLLGRVLRRARVQEAADRLVVLPHCDLLPDLLAQVPLVWQSGEVAVGGAILDAMACGVPAVAVESDAARQLIADGASGAIAPAVPQSVFPRRAFTNHEDTALAARMAVAAGARAAACFPAAASVAAHVALHRRLAG